MSRQSRELKKQQERAKKYGCDAKFFVVFKKFAMSIPARVTGMLSGQMEPSELRRCEKEIAAEVNRLLGAFVIAGIVGPEDVKKDGTLKEEKNTDS